MTVSLEALALLARWATLGPDPRPYQDTLVCEGVLASCACCGRDVALDVAPVGGVLCAACEIEGYSEWEDNSE